MPSVRPVPAVWKTAEARAFRNGSPAFGLAMAVPFFTLWLALFALPLTFLLGQSQHVPGGALARLVVHLWPGTPVAGGPFDIVFGIVVITVVAVIVGACTGVPAAYAMARHPFDGAAAVPYCAALPLLLPTPVLAVALSAALRLHSFQWPAWIAAAAMANVPLVLWCTRAALHHAALLPLEEAAATCGLTPAARFVEIALPTLAPHVGVALLVATLLTASELALATALGHAWASAFTTASHALHLAGAAAVPSAGIALAGVPMPTPMPIRDSAVWAAYAPPLWTVAVALAAPATLRVACVAAWARQVHRPLSATPWGIS